MEKEYVIVGFDTTGENVIFIDKHDKYVIIKHTLPKNQLIVFLDIPPSIINKELRNDILEEARKRGRKFKVFSIDNKHFQKNPNFINKIKDGPYLDYKFFDYVSENIYKQAPDRV